MAAAMSGAGASSSNDRRMNRRAAAGVSFREAVGMLSRADTVASSALADKNSVPESSAAGKPASPAAPGGA